MRDKVSSEIKTGTPQQMRPVLKSLLKEVTISETKISMIILQNKLGNKTDHTTGVADDDPAQLDINVQLQKSHKNKKLIIPGAKQMIQKPDPKLIKLIANAHI